MDDNPSTTASELIPLPALPTPDSFPFPYPQPYDIQLQLMQTVFRAVEEGKIAIVREAESDCDFNRTSVAVADKPVPGGEPNGDGEELDPADRDVDVVGREPEAPGRRGRGESSSASLSGRPGWWVRCLGRRLKSRPTMGD